MNELIDVVVAKTGDEILLQPPLAWRFALTSPTLARWAAIPVA
jgi:cytochrome c-type biogenesis protein CcmH/NrfF